MEAELTYRPTHRTVTRLVTYPEVPHHIVRVRVRPSVILRELDRIQYRPRSTLAISAVDDFLRSSSSKLEVVDEVEDPKFILKPSLTTLAAILHFQQFEDETRRIRADTRSLLQRARSTVPRAKSVVPYDTIFNYGYGEPIPYRFSNEAYIARLLSPLRSVGDTIRFISYYNDPAPRFTGRGQLASVHYSGGKAFSNRGSLYKELSIRDDVNLLSFYAKNRLAAHGLAGDKATAAQEQPTAALCA